MTAFRSFFRRLRDDRRGTVLVEFAVAAPVVLTVGVVGLEMAHFAIANHRVTQLAAVAADSASRVRDSIDEADVIEILAAAKMSGEKIDFAQNGRIIMSSLEPNAAANGQWIRWQRCDGRRSDVSDYGAEGKGRTDTSLPGMGVATRRVAALPGTAVIFVEVEYRYQPIVAQVVFQTPRVIRTEVAFNVRQRTNQALTNASAVTTAQMRTCDKFQA